MSHNGTDDMGNISRGHCLLLLLDILVDLEKLSETTVSQKIYKRLKKKDFFRNRNFGKFTHYFFITKILIKSFFQYSNQDTNVENVWYDVCLIRGMFNMVRYV